MTTTLPIILQNYITANCIHEYKLEDITKGKFGDIKVLPNEIIFVYEIYFEYKGDCMLTTENSILASAKMIECVKNSYTDELQQIKTFTKSATTVIKEDFTFSGTGKNPLLKYLKLTILDTGK